MRFALTPTCIVGIAILAALYSPLPAVSGEVPAEIQLTYDVAEARPGRTAPQLKVVAGGRSIGFGIDTGAGMHTLASWYARAAGLSPANDAPVRVTGSGGGQVELPIVHDVRLPLSGGQALLLSEAIVANFPPIFEKKGIGGVVSPQLLAPTSSAAVLDLATPRLRFARFAEALVETGARKLGAENVTIHASNAGLRNRHYIVKTIIAGVPVRLLLDTGASNTTLNERSDAIEALGVLSPGRVNVGIDGRRETEMRSAPRPVDFGVGPIMIRVSVSRNAGGPVADGMLGMNALRTCTLILAESALGVACAR
jgi:predicted aspartyl protease